MEKKKHNLNNGITLVALVITIIVLLILAGVAINMAINSDGLFGKANDAVTKWNSAVQDESDSIWDLLNIGNKEDKPEELQKGDVELSYTITDKQINLQINITGMPEPVVSVKHSLSFLGRLVEPGKVYTEEQTYDFGFKDMFGKTYEEFMENPDKIVKDAVAEAGGILEITTAAEYFELFIKANLGETAYQLAIDTAFPKQLLPELEEKTEEEIKSLVESYYNNEKTFNQIVAEVEGVSTLEEAVANRNGVLGITSEDEYIISREETLNIIAAKAYTATRPLVVTKPDNTTENIAWFGKNSETITYNITEAGDYIFTVLAPSGKTQEIIVKICSLTLDKQRIVESIVEGQEVTETLTAILANLDESKLLWTTSDENIAEIEGIGTTVNIKIKSKGTATITATCGEYSETCSITATNLVSSFVTEGTRKAPIPVGYVASQITTEDTISEGLVIYQGTDTVTGEANSTAHTTAMTTRNQFVWIPVDDINYMVMCKSNASRSVCDLDLIDGVLQCTNSAHSSTATDLCGRVYERPISVTKVDGKSIYTYSQTFNEVEWTKQTWDPSSYREPDIVSSNDEDSNTRFLTAAGVSTANQLATQLTNDFIAMATSVAKYGGFYVSRYEAGANGASLKNQKVLVAEGGSATGYDTNTFTTGNLWYGMYNTLRTSTVIDKTAVSSHMIWGSQYDMIIKYLGENNLNEPQVGHTARQLATQELTGETTTDIMSNIYDLEGNNREWTAQAYSTNGRAYMGGDFYSVGGSKIIAPAFFQLEVYPYATGCRTASRSVLYLK